MANIKDNALKINNEADNFPETRKAMNILGKELIAEISILLIKYNKIATGNLLKNIDYQIRTVGDRLHLEIKEKNTPEPYLVYVSGGRKAGTFPNISKIRKWIDDKPIKIIPNKKGKIISKDALAYLISRKIFREGIKPTHLIQEAMKAVYANKTQLIKEAVNKDVKNEMNFIVNDIKKEINALTKKKII